MSDRSQEDLSVPHHVTTKLVDVIFELKSDVGRVEGKVDGINSTLGDMNGRISQAVTRPECAAQHAALVSGKKGSASTPKIPLSMLPHDEDGWKKAQVRIGVFSGLLVLLITIGSGFYYMATEYNEQRRAKEQLVKQTQHLGEKLNKVLRGMHPEPRGRDDRDDSVYGPPAPGRRTTTTNTPNR